MQKAAKSPRPHQLTSDVGNQEGKQRSLKRELKEALEHQTATAELLSARVNLRFDGLPTTSASLIGRLRSKHFLANHRAARYLVKHFQNPIRGIRPGVFAVHSSSPDPSHARVVSAEFTERCRTGNGIRHIIVAAVGMRDGVPANRARATLKTYDLALKSIIVRQDDAATVQKRERSRNNSLWSRILVAPLIFPPQALVPIATIPLSQWALLALAGPLKRRQP